MSTEVKVNMEDSSEVDDAYMAGFFDGEGCVTISRPRSRKNYQLEVNVGNTSRDVLEWVQRNYGGRLHDMQGSRPARYKPYSVWQVSGVEATDFLRQVLPFLKVKREEAELAVKFPHWGRQGRGHRIPEEVKHERQRLSDAIRGIRESR